MSMIRKLTLAAALAAGLISSAAAQSSFTAKDAGGVTRTFASFNCSSLICSMAVPADQTGAAFGVSANPFYMAFGAGVQLPGFAAAPSVKLQDGSGNSIGSTSGSLNVNITGGGGGGSSYTVTFGSSLGTLGTPSGFKDSSGNFQSLLGDTSNGQWVNVKASALPSGAATQATLASILTALGTPFQAGASIGNTSFIATQSIGTNLHMVCDSGCSSSSSPSFGATFPTTGTPIGMSQGGLLTALTGTGGALNVNISSGSIANTSFGISGTLPGFASTPTVNLGTIGGAATQTTLAAIQTALGSPFQAGGAIGNTSFGLTPTNTAGIQSAAVESNHVLKSSAGGLIGITVTIGATSGWLMMFDATTAPADGAVTPKYCRYIKSDGTGGASSIFWNPSPLTFSTGIVSVFSSTGCFTKTASATAYFSGQVQ